MGRRVSGRAAAWTGGALLALAGCVVAPAEDPDCEGGAAYTEAGNAMCVYRGGIQETGFECPGAMPHRGDFGDFTVCSERPVDRPMADRAWCASGHCDAPRELPDGGAPPAVMPPRLDEFDPGNAWATTGLVVHPPLHRRPPSSDCGPGLGSPGALEARGRGLSLWNASDTPLTILDVRVEPPERFLVANDVAQAPPTPWVLAPGERTDERRLLVYGRCAVDGPGVAHVVFETDDADRPEVRVPIVVAAPAPCVGPVRVESVDDQTVRVRLWSCGEGTRLASVTLEGADDFGLLSPPDVAADLPDIGNTDIAVGHAADAPRPFLGALVVTSNDPLTPVLRIPLDWAR